MKHYEAQSKFANNHTNSIDNFAYAKHGLSKIKGAKKNFLLHLKQCEFGYSDKKTQKEPNIDIGKTFIVTAI